MNSEQQQQRIMGYFIEEAREHLQTIEQGVLNLQDILDEPESINELFRAAHSIKGGSAMLGVGSIQHVAHRLEDFFKIIKENPHINVDEKLKSLLLAGFDPLAELLDELQVGFRISDELTLETSNRVKPIFAELQSYLNQLTSGGEAIAIEPEAPVEVAPQPAKIESLASVFQKEVTTKMRDMLQLFRGEDSSATRADLQVICTYFQEIGNNFGLKNWANLVTQIKNAIAQPVNTYRTLAPIVIRELKEAQDLVLANREAEIIVSAQIQNLLPSWFAETEDDEVSTIFTTAAGNIEEDDSILEELAVSSTTVTETQNTTITDLEEIDLFADPSSEEVFDLSEGQDSTIDQLDWIDGEYEISENQHIDGPKIGASELKSLAVLFENDDIDFDAAWEDIESNETNMMNQGMEQATDNQDDFADLLGQEYDNQANVASSKSTSEESNIDQLFGDFPTEELTGGDNQIPQDGLFPDDLDNAWVESPITNSDENSGLEDLLSNDGADQGDIDLGIDIIDQIHSFEPDEINLPEADDANDLLSSEDYFATLDDEESSQDIPSDFEDNGDDTPNEPFALTLSEEDMALLEDPFAIDANLDKSLMEASDAIAMIDATGSPDNSDDTSGLNIFDELGFDSDDFDTTSGSHATEVANIVEPEADSVSSDFNDINLGNDDLADFFAEDNAEPQITIATSEASEFEEQFNSADDLASMFSEAVEMESNENTNENPEFSFDENIDDLGSDPLDNVDDFAGFEISEVNGVEVGNEIGNEIVNTDGLEDFLDGEAIEKANPDVDSNESIGGFLGEVADTLTNEESLGDFFDETNAEVTTDDLGDFFSETNAEVTTDDLGDFFSETNAEVTNTADLGDFFGEVDDEQTNEVTNTEELGDFFGEDAEANAVTNTDDLGNFFSETNAEVNSTEEMGDFLGEEDSVVTNEITNTDDLGDFFGEDASLVSNTEELGNFFGDDEIAVNNTEELNNFFGDVEESTEQTDDFGALDTTESENNLEIFADEAIDGVVSDSSYDLDNELGDFLENIQEINENGDDDFAIADVASPISTAIKNADELSGFFADVEEDLIDGFTFSNDISSEINDSEETDNFFSDMESAQVETLGSESTNELNDNDDLVDFFASSDESAHSIEKDFADFEQELNAESESFTQLTQSAATFDERNFDLLGATEQEESNLATLFSSAGEDDLTVIENEMSLNEARSLTQVESQADINDFLSDDFFGETGDDLAGSSLDEELTSIQDRFNDLDTELKQMNVNDNEDVTASTTIDNLVDFFQGDDDDSMSLDEDAIVNDNSLEVDAIADFDGLVTSSDDELEVANDSLEQQAEMLPNPPSNTASSGEFAGQSVIEELNGIDDNFNFDDLEAMIGNSGNELTSSMNGMGLMGESQTTATLASDQQPPNSEDMDFDELEALLGDTGSFDSPVVNEAPPKSAEAAPAKPVDDFDELENMLQSAFAKDVGPIKTKTPTRPPAAARKQRMADTTMRVDVKYLDSLNNLVGELVVNRNLLEQDQERLQQFITSLLHQVQMLSDVSQRMRDQYDRSLLEASLTAGRGGRSYNSFESSFAIEGSSSNSTVSSEFEGIEFDRYNTFHVLSQEIIELIVRVRESASDIEFVVGETDQVTRQLGTITTQIQDDLKQSRMVPFAQIADRLPRGIRDRALKTGKQAELEIFGRETLIDKAILESLTDPLTHLVNNAIDHGLEDPVTRQAAGKPATGKLTVRAYHQGNQTVISISDDGAGISIDKVKKSAVAKKVRTLSEVDRLNDTEVYSLLFEPGFSTAAQADEFKGRGVGLDVVKTCLDEIRGVIIVESVVGKGTTFTIRLPLTLSISKAMFCISDRARIAFPVDGFEDMVEVPQSQIVLNEKGQPCLPWRDTILPFQHLSNLLSYSRHLSRSNIYGKQDNDELCIIILRNDTNYLALQVDQFLGEYEIVIKQLEGPIPQPAGIAGATVLGDGRVMAIANVLELFDIASGRLRPSASGVVAPPPIEEDVAVDPTVLIVDDSITVRELLSLTFAKVGYRVEQAKDGQDAWEKLRAGLPCDMIFCDIEMPRMDGLDLLSRLQKDSRLKEIPVAMLTSRGADRHRQSAIQLGAKGYFTKPYLEEELLSASKRLLAGETLPI